MPSLFEADICIITDREISITKVKHIVIYNCIFYIYIRMRVS